MEENDAAPKLTSNGRRWPKKHTQEQKREIIAFAFDNGLPAAAQKYDVQQNTISTWKTEFRVAMEKDNRLFAKYNTRGASMLAEKKPKPVEPVKEVKIAPPLKPEPTPLAASSTTLVFCPTEAKIEEVKQPVNTADVLFSDNNQSKLLRENNQLKQELSAAYADLTKMRTRADLLEKLNKTYQQ